MNKRYHLEISGVVQGVGFRPFVYNLAMRLELSGWVFNHAAGVSIEIEGADANCQSFIELLKTDAPPLASVEQVEVRQVNQKNESGFNILSSQAGHNLTLVSPDVGVCQDCIEDISLHTDRRWQYPFTNCTNCGPRFTIIKKMPYDRANTTMSSFQMCPECETEYLQPQNRRFHAQPNACPKCGPWLSFYDVGGQQVPGDPIELACNAISAGSIIAVKGIGGYHLVCGARSEAAVNKLRQRKFRYDKPFAVMMPDVETVRHHCLLSEEEERLLLSPEKPIVLLKKYRYAHELPDAIAPNSKLLGVMLPYTPLHFMLMQRFAILVMTSANASDEPIVFHDEEAILRLGHIADGFLMNNREIFRRCDDSVMFMAAGQQRFQRRSRGYAPKPIDIAHLNSSSILACGAEQKNTFCLTRGKQAFVSQHIGDLDSPSTLEMYKDEISDFIEMFGSEPTVIAHDLHPDYLSTAFAQNYNPTLQKIAVQHHHAHLASVLAENKHQGAAIGLIFDGTGWGTDGTLWGGEVLLGDCAGYVRAAHLLPFALPGGTASIKEPWRVALSCLYSASENDASRVGQLAPPHLLQPGWETVLQAIEQGTNSPISSSLGRLFDAVAALAGIRSRVNYEGQAAVEMEQIIDSTVDDCYDFDFIDEKEGIIIDWHPMFAAALADVLAGEEKGAIAARFHNAIIKLCLDICLQLREQHSINTVALSGGCWQNVWLLERASSILEENGFLVLSNVLLPSNDGGVAYGQAAVAAALLK